MVYPAFFFEECDGGYIVLFPGLNIAACGDNINQALEMATECLRLCACDLKEKGMDMPKAPDVENVDVKSLYSQSEKSFAYEVYVDDSTIVPHSFNATKK